MGKLKIWLKAIRAPFFTASAVPIFVGSALSYRDGFFNLALFILTLFGGILFHAGANLANDYFDQKADDMNKNPTPFSGGSRVIQEKILSARQILRASWICFTLSALFGVVIAILGRWEVVVIGAFGILIGYIYTALPMKLSYRGFGEILVGIGFGPMMLLGAYFVQTGTISLSPVIASIFVGALITAVLHINEFADYEADKMAGKNNLVVKMGLKHSLPVFYSLIVLTYAALILGFTLGVFPLVSLITFITLPITIKILMVLTKNFADQKALLPANGMTIILHFTFGIIFTISIVVDRIFFA